MSNILNAKITTSSTDNTNEYEGVLVINSEESLKIDRINGIVYLEIRGRLVSKKEQVISFNIDSNNIISKGETYEIPFSFILDKKTVQSYSGKNVSFSYKCEAQIFVNEDDLEKLDRSVLTRVKSFITADYSTKVSCYFEKKGEENNYKVDEKHGQFKLEFNPSAILFGILIIVAIYILSIITFSFEFNGFHILPLVIAVILYCYIDYRMKSKKIGNISLSTRNEEHGFNCIIKPARNFSLKSAKIHYQIEEEVVDRRGTSSSTYTETIFKSPIKLLKTRGTSEIEFEFPTNQQPTSLEYGDVTIYWELVITGIHSGIKEKLKCRLYVFSS